MRNDPGRFRSPHANVLGRLVPNGLPTGKKAETRPSVDLTSEVQHVGIHKVSLEHAEEKSAVDRPDLVCCFHTYSRKDVFRAWLVTHRSYAHEVNAKRSIVI